MKNNEDDMKNNENELYKEDNKDTNELYKKNEDTILRKTTKTLENNKDI